MFLITLFLFLPKNSKADKSEFYVEKGESSWHIASRLEKANLIWNKFLFMAYAVIRGEIGSLQAGRYMISPSLNTPSILAVISNGLVVTDDVIVTIPEGSNVAEIGEILEKTGLLKNAADFIMPETLAMEGTLFPDTYKISRVRSEGREADYTKEIIADVVGKMKRNFEAQTEGLFPSPDPEKNRETIILASILEKEVRQPEDMRLVAGIIKKRQILDMPLKMDATVAYGFCNELFVKGKFCDVTRVSIVDNLRVDSMYNTYMRRGLPGGPISNPGLQSIKAALNPKPSEYLYYLNTRDGTTVYSKTGLEHETNRQKYLGLK